MYLVLVKGQGGAPEEILLRDRALQFDLVIWLILVILSRYVL
jgi:hypothetical protein